MLSVLRYEARVLVNTLRAPRCRQASTSGYVPPAANRDQLTRRQFAKEELPESSNVFTGKAPFFDAVDNLETAVSASRQALKKLHLFPLPPFALQSLPPAQHAWKNNAALSSTLGIELKPSRYTRILTLVKQLDEYKRVAVVAGYENLAASISDVLEVFEREDKEAYLLRGQRKPVEFDEYGRTYTVGRRKESGARVWVIPTRSAAEPTVETTAASEMTPEELLPGSLASSLPGLSPTVRPVVSQVPVSQIIVNNASLSEYFQNPSDRERVIRPLKLTGLLGAFNVFAIARGGGTTGQSGAISLGIAKALMAHVPEVTRILRKAKLHLRDPRMVERKKPGLAKARKAYAWVKR